MTIQIPCVGGPLDGELRPWDGREYYYAPSEKGRCVADTRESITAQSVPMLRHVYRAAILRLTVGRAIRCYQYDGEE